MIDFSDLLILMVVIWTLGKVFRVFRLPMVFGELLGGILVGPALLNVIQPDNEVIRVVAEFGIFFLMLHSGLESDPEKLLNSSKKSIFIALGSAIVPFFGGYFTALMFGYAKIAAFFVGMCISISAIAICARLFKEHNMVKDPVAHLSVGAAIFGDILGLILFSVALNFHEKGAIELLPVIGLIIRVIIFFGIVIYGGLKLSPHMNKIINFNNKGFTLTLIIALLMGLIAEAIGLHMIIGAFLAGLFIREEVLDKKVFEKIEDRIYGLSYSFFGPIFFASLAFHLDFTAFYTTPYFMVAILAVAIVGKMAGSGIVTKFMKMKALESIAIGLALNSRGAVELIIASIGLQMGIIDNNIFSVLVLMAFTTTVFSILFFGPIAKKLKTTQH